MSTPENMEFEQTVEAVLHFVTEAKKLIRTDPNTVNSQKSEGGIVQANPEGNASPGDRVCCWDRQGDYGQGKGTVIQRDVKPAGVNGQTDGSNKERESTRQAEKDCRKLGNQVEKLRRDLTYMKRELSKLNDLKADLEILVKEKIATEKVIPEGADTSSANFPIQLVQEKFQILTEKVKNVKNQMPGHKVPSQLNEAHQAAVGAVFNAYCVFEKMSNSANLKLRMKEKVQDTPAFKEFLEDFVGVFEGLDRQTKLCLFCFSIFPENAVVNKRLLVHWWIGEGLVDPPLTGNKEADDILKELLSVGFVEPVMKKRKMVGFKMSPLVRLVVINLAEKAGFFHFNGMGVPTANFTRSFRACLASTGKEARIKDAPNLDKLRTIFNVNDPYPDFTIEVFSKLKNLTVLNLGGWESSARYHIEVEGTEFLKGVRNMKHLKFFSLAGISRISELPDEICKLKNLRIVDLSACHNLEKLPKTLDQLKNLTHLDISRCYLLDHIPKELASLTRLQVLKGFVIGESGSMAENSCGLKDLGNLHQLKKLSISTSREDFPAEEELQVLCGFEDLKKLTIEWGVKGNTTQQDNHSEAAPPAKQPPAKRPSLQRTLAFRTPGVTIELEKLELVCFPKRTVPFWMIEGTLMPLKKLYIRGGNLRNLAELQGLSVKILCLKFLADLKMDWMELQKAFPSLVYLETVCCPKLTFFPCNESGVWLNKAVKQQQGEEEELGLSWSFLMSSTTRSDASYFPKPANSGNRP